jgi:hypothetical protein
MIRLELAGAHTRLGSSLCGRCPQGPAGCCAAPPAVAWADIGRIVSLGGRSWLLDQIRTGCLRPGARGLSILRVGSPDVGPARCVYHGPEGCTIPPEQRSATCNYYLCDDALVHGGEARGDPAAVAGREAHEALTAFYGRWDLEIAERIRRVWPEGVRWDEPLLDWLGREVERLIRRDRKELPRLEVGHHSAPRS